MTITIAGGRRVFSYSDAQAIVAGYAFATCEIVPSRDARFRAAFTSERVPRWGYRTYDCVPAAPGDAFDDTDILVAAGLNGRLDVESVAALRVATNRAAGPLAEAARLASADRVYGPQWQWSAFVDMSAAEVSANPPLGSAGAALAEAWTQMMATPDIGVALTHKVLHHKRPTLVPLLDEKTATFLKDSGSDHERWGQIHRECNDNRAELEDLRTWFAPLASEHNGVALGILRLYDILLWLGAMNWINDAREEGEKLIAGLR